MTDLEESGVSSRHKPCETQSSTSTSESGQIEDVEIIVGYLALNLASFSLQSI